MGEIVTRVVVTGSQGFIGRRLVARLAAEGLHVLAIDRTPLEDEPCAGVDYRLSDLMEPAHALPADWIGADFTLVHLAWRVARGGGFRAHAEHVAILAGLLDTWAGQGLAHAIAMGSAEEYGQRGGVLAEDDAPVEPLTPYGWGKRAGQSLALAWAESAGVPLLWLRPFVVYGPGQSGDMLIPYAIRRALERQPAEFTDGSQARDFVYVDDVVDAIVLGIRKRPSGAAAVNLGRGEPVRVRDVLGEIERLLDARGLFQIGALPRRQGEPDVFVADNHRAKELLGWEPHTDWRQGLKECCRVARDEG